MKKDTVLVVLCRIFIALMLLITYLPIIIIIIFSFSPNKVLGNWSAITWSAELYTGLIENSKIMTAAGNTIILAVSSSLLATFIGTFSAVGIFHLRKLPKAMINTVSQITVVNADIVTGVSFMLFFYTVLGGIDGFPALIIAHTVITMPYVILSVTPRLNQINPNMYEAGLDLGAGPVRTLFTVMMPQLIPGMISGFGLAFTLSLDDFVVSKFINGDVETISTLIYKSTRHGINPEFRALSAIMFVLLLAVLLFINFKSRKKAK